MGLPNGFQSAFPLRLIDKAMVILVGFAKILTVGREDQTGLLLICPA